MNHQHAPRDSEANAAAMQCPQCGGAAVELALIRTAFWQSDGLVVLEGLPALSCRQCGEQFYDDATATMLDLLRGDGFANDQATRSLVVPVFDYKTLVERRNGVPREASP